MIYFQYEVCMNRLYLVFLPLLALLLLPGAAFAGPQVSVLQVGSRPTGLAFGADGTLFVSHGEGYTLTTIAPDGTQGAVQVGTLPLSPVVDSGLGRAFVAN